MMVELVRSSHKIFKIKYHVVFCIKYRKDLFLDEKYVGTVKKNCYGLEERYTMKFLKEDFKPEELVIGRGNKINYDEIDYEILKILTEHAQTSLVDIATHLKMSAPSVLYSIE